LRKLTQPCAVQFTPHGDGYFVVQGCILPSNTCGRLFQIGSYNRFHQVADLGAFEIAHNPDGLHPGESDPYGVLALNHQRVIADAAANDLLSVSDTGAISVLAVFPERTVSGILVLEIAENSLASGDPTGALIRVARDGSRRTIMDRGPGSSRAVAVGDDGDLFVSNHGQEAGVGEVLRIHPGR
jgi:hypothetical protein